jgi:hypothetical protein
MADPDVGAAVVHEQAGLADQSQVQAGLQVDQHDSERHADQGREQLAAVGHHRFEGEQEHGGLAGQAWAIAGRRLIRSSPRHSPDILLFVVGMAV